MDWIFSAFAPTRGARCGLSHLVERLLSCPMVPYGLVLSVSLSLAQTAERPKLNWDHPDLLSPSLLTAISALC